MKRIYFLLLYIISMGLLLSSCGLTQNTDTTPIPGTTSSPANPPATTASTTPTELTHLPIPTRQAPPIETPSASTPLAGKHDKVRFALDWTPNTNHTGIFVAIQKGWYAEQGIDVEILPYSDANTPDTLVTIGRADFGISFEESVVTDRVNKLPIKSVAAVLQTNTSAIATLKASTYNSPATLEGKRYAGFGSTYEEPVIRTVLKSAGAPTGKFQNITTNLSGYEALTERQADFMWLYMGWEGIQADLQNVELNTFMIKDYGVPDYYTPVIISNERYLQSHADIARRFLAATARGYEYGVANPPDAADLLIKANPREAFPDTALPHDSQRYLAPFYKADQPHWGTQTLDKWTNFPRFIASTGLLKTSDGKVVNPDDIDYASLFTNDYLPKP